MSSAGTVNDIRDALDHPADMPNLAEPGEIGRELGDGSRAERPPFPPGCPVTPLGKSAGLDGSQAMYYLDYNGQLVALEAGNRHGKNSLIALFGPASDWLEASFPQWSKPVYEGRGNSRVLVQEAQIVGFDQAEASRALIEECVRRGIFDPAGRMRGVGAHRQRGGGMVLHCGDKLLASRHHPTSGELQGWNWLEPGLHEGYVYTAAAPVPRPWHEPAAPDCAQHLLVKLLMTWNCKRPLLDPRLMLGAIGASMIGGWLPWRPHVMITGGAGTGKSTLNGENGVLEELFGAGQFRTENTSAAAIRSSLQNSTVPVMLDELEADADNRRVIEVIETARVASSGGKITRGSAEQKTKEFTLRSTFWMSMISPPPLKPQDRSRIAIVELKPIREGAAKLTLADFHLPQLGRKLMRRMIDGLPRLEATTAVFHDALQAKGHTARACDQFGTLLACADLLMHDRPGVPDAEEVDQWATLARPEGLAEIADQVPDQQLCLDQLLTSDVQASGRDDRVTVANWIGAAVRRAMQPLLEASGSDEKAAARLQEMGLRIVNARWKAEKQEWGTQAFAHEEPGFLCVSNNHQALKRIFASSSWQEGGWVRALGRSEGALERVPVKIGHQTQRSVLVPLWQVLDADELPNASQREAHRAWMAEWQAGHGEGAGA